MKLISYRVRNDIEIYSPRKWLSVITKKNKEITQTDSLQIQRKLMATELLSVALPLIINWQVNYHCSEIFSKTYKVSIVK